MNQPASLASAPSSIGNARISHREELSTYLGISLDAWVKLAILAPLFIALYWIVLRWLWDKTNPIWGEANWGHAICIPIIGLYYLYINREELLRQPVEPLLMGPVTAQHRLIPGAAMLLLGAGAYLLGNDPSGYIKDIGGAAALYGFLVLLLDWGLGSLICGLAIFAYGIWPGQNQFLQGCAMVLTLFGVVLMLYGWKIMRYAWFPIFYILCGVPWPDLIYSYVASPLQTLAAKAAVVTLRFTGVTAFRTGTKINYMAHNGVRTLNVAEACAGLRSLMTFITVGVAIAFLSARPLWQKIIISLSAIPIAIFCNVMRICGQGLLDNYVSQQLSDSFAHQFVGLVMLVPAFFMILGVGWLLDHLFVEEVDERENRYANRAAADPSLVIEVPRRAAAATQPAAPAKTQAPLKAQAPASAKPQAGGQIAPKSQAPKPQAPKPQAPPAAVTPPRPGIIPPRPGIIPPRGRKEGHGNV